jgi:hemolysin activation/secretion protein
VRGYRENLLVRDSGWIASLEYRHPVLRDLFSDTNVQLAIFSDYGKAWFEDFSTPDPKNIGSAGIGVRFDTHRRLFGELYYAHPFRKIDYNGNDIQDIGIHFNLTYRVL